MSKTAGFTVTVFASCLDPGFNMFSSNITEICTDNLYVDSICEFGETERIKCVCSFESDSPFMVPNCEWELFEQTTTTASSKTVLPDTTEQLSTVLETTEEMTTFFTTVNSTDSTTTFTIDTSTETSFENQYCSENRETYEFDSGKLVCFGGFCELDCHPGTIPARLTNYENGHCSKYSHPKRINCTDVIDHREMKCVSQCGKEVLFFDTKDSKMFYC